MPSGARKQMLCGIVGLMAFYSARPLHADPLIELPEAQAAYLRALEPIPMVVDPDWVPYELLDADGNLTGIAADLVELIARRLNTRF